MTPFNKFGVSNGVGIGAVLLIAGIIAYPYIMSPSGELGQKQEWSVLQGVSLDHQNSPQTDGVLIVKNALGSEFTAIGFPARGQHTGYVWLLANPFTKPCVKQMPRNQDFSVSSAAIAFVESATPIDARVKAYLESPSPHVLESGYERASISDHEGCRA